MMQALRRFIQSRRSASAERAVEHRRSLLSDLPVVKAAVAGCGRFAARHLETLQAMPNVQLTGICNRSGEGLDEICRKYGIAGGYAGVEAMLDRASPDAVWVVVGHTHTAAVAEACLRRGIPCLIEKPAAFSAETVLRLAETAEQHRAVNMVGVNRRYLSVLQAGLAEILRRGPLLGVEINAPEAIRRLRKQGVDPDLADRWLTANSIHAIDLFRCVGGEVEDFAGFRYSFEETAGDGFTASMRLKSGALGTFTAHWLSVPGWSMRLYGEGIRADLNLETGAALVDTRLRRATIPPSPVDLRFKPGLYAQNEAFVNCVACGTVPCWPASTLRDQVGTMRLIQQIGEAA
jgi:predicted dehydrogenase